MLDIDLDFFVDDPVHWRSSRDERVSDDDHPTWTVDDALNFLEDRCGLVHSLPGWVVEHHAEAFPLWRRAVRSGRLPIPFHLTHVDAHADLGLGDAGYVQLITDLLHRPVDQRDEPHGGEYGIDDGNWLAFAVGCRWISDMTYVYCPGGGDDLLKYHLADDGSDALQLKAATKEQMDRSLYGMKPLEAVAYDPTVPLVRTPGADFTAGGDAYDFITLCRSPGFTPPAADAVFDAIRERYVDESAIED